jgi:hypothetical protein
MKPGNPIKPNNPIKPGNAIKPINPIKPSNQRFALGGPSAKQIVSIPPL